MSPRYKIIVLALVVLGVGGALALRQLDEDTPTATVSPASASAANGTSTMPAPTAAPPAATVTSAATASRPKLVELGSARCQSCKAMHAELAALKAECPGGLEIEILDVYKDEDKARPYGVEVIPTQVFLDRDGKEIDRHIGFLPRAQILERFARLEVACP